MTVLDPVPEVFVLAGESSGDLIGALLLKGLQQLHPHLHYGGIGGPRMVELGFDAQIPMERLAVRGYAEVLRHLPALLRLRKQLANDLIAQPPKVFIGVDAPDFNLGLEEKLRLSGIKTLHLVCPSIWAWRAERGGKIKRAVDHLLCVFPFEVELLQKLGIPATYVGHPLGDMIALEPDPQGARDALRIPRDAFAVGLLPGSRRDEIVHIAPRFFKAAELIRAKEPNAIFLMPAAGPERKDQLQRMLKQYPAVQVQLIDGQSHRVLEASDGVLVASGTATLEAALYKKPMVIAYVMPKLTWWMMKDKGYLPYVGLPNILAGEFLVPELLQDRATPEALACALIEQVRDTRKKEQLNERFHQIHLQLRRGFSHSAAQAVAQFL
jgi:lipid-A-disaccharide synthase